MRRRQHAEEALLPLAFRRRLGMQVSFDGKLGDDVGRQVLCVICKSKNPAIAGSFLQPLDEHLGLGYHRRR